MATPPTLIAYNEGASWDTTTTPKTTAAFNSAVGDVWVSGTVAEDNVAAVGAPTNTGTAQTFSARGAVDTSNYTELHSYSTVVANTLTAQTISAARAGTTLKYNVGVARFSGSDGIGAVPAGEAETDNTAPSLSITTSFDNSAIVVFMGDWDAADGASRTWRTVNSITPTAGNGYELAYFRNSSNYAVYVGYYPDAGAAGAKTVGLTAPTTGKFAIAAIEVRGSATTNATVNATTVAATTALPAPAIQTGSTFTATAVAAVAALPAPTVTVQTVVAPATIAATAAMPAPAVQTGSTVAATAITVAASLPAPALQTGSVVAATAVAAVGALPAPTITAVTAVSPATITAVAVLPAPALQTGSTVAATTVAAVTSLPAPTVSTATNATVTATAIATAAALPVPSLQTGSVVSSVTVAAVAALPAPTVSTAGNATVNATAVASVAAVGVPSLATDQTVVATAIAAVLAMAAPSIDTGAGTGTYTHHVTIAAARNGTADHTVHPDGTGGSVVDGATFTPTAGALLLCFIEGAVTSTTPTGWTLPTNGSAINNSGLYVFHREADGTSADQVATTHNASNYPVVFDFYEFGTDAAFGAAASGVNVSSSGGAGPTLSGLTGTNWTAGIAAQATNTTATTVTWDLGTEEVDTGEAASGTDGYTYSLTYEVGNTASSVAYAATFGAAVNNVERLVIAVDAGTGAVDATVPASAVATVTALPAPAVVTPDATVIATAIATVTSLPVPTVQTAGNMTVTPPAVATVTALPAPAVKVGVTVTPTVVGAIAEIPGIEQADATVAPDAIATVTALPAPAVQTAGNATVAATSIATVTALPVPTISTGTSATVSATAIATVTSLPAPSLQTGQRVNPAVIATVTALPVPTSVGLPVGIQGNAYPPSGAATGNVYPRSDGGIIGSVA